MNGHRFKDLFFKNFVLVLCYSIEKFPLCSVEALQTVSKNTSRDQMTQCLVS